MEYSVQRDAVYCFVCQFFPSPSDYAEETFVKEGFRNWKKTKEKIERHVKSEAHQTSIAQWGRFKQAEACDSVASQLDRQRATVVEEN